MLRAFERVLRTRGVTMYMKKLAVFALTMLFSGLPIQGITQQLTPEEMEEWLFDDSDSLIAEVNEGQLEFLASVKQDKPVHHHYNSMTINDDSIRDGWVKMEQCHSNLDPVPLAQIVFGKDRVRNLAVSRLENVGKAWVEGNSIQLEAIEKQATLCISAETRTFVYNGDGTFSLRSGPFMRRFLDGYYPMRVTMDVKFDTKRLRYFQTSPVAQDGFSVSYENQQVHVDALFEGRLNTDIQFHDLVSRDPVAKQDSGGRIAKLKAKQ